jgi:hypothetical protein
MARKPITDMSAWPSLTLEGNLIAPAMVAQISEPKDDTDTRDSYGIRKGLNIREEISTAFRVGQSHFNAFAKLGTPSLESTRRFIRDFLKETFGFDDLVSSDGVISFISGERVPIVVVPPTEDKLDRRSPTLSTDRSRSPAFALQDYLNDNDEILWGLVTNGVLIRLMRDNASLTRPAYIEADLAQIFTNEDAASFATLFLMIHRSRFGTTGAATDCALERWREAGSREGEAARDRLAGQVELALKVLGSGFLEANPELASKLKSGEVNLTDWFNELLRLVYRLIFMMVAEDRNLLHPENTKTDARKLYSEGYSLASLRAQCFRASSWDKHYDRYEGIKIVFRALAHGQERLALPALGGLFSEDKLPHLETARLRNKAFMEGLYRLSWLSDKTGMVPVNWRAMETEELGSVYESLLELQPQLGVDGKSLVFASETAEQKGNQRKTTGSYYTPDSLVQALLDTALDPVLDKTEAEADDPAKALLKLSVIDPACGSGHFLLAAARRIATRLARIRADGTPSLADFRHALRDVARCCIHGVDRNPMAVELTKVALWIETVDPGLPLGFFDAQIRCGDALLGVFDLKVLQDGIPDAAYKPLTGDDKDTASIYKKANAAAKGGQGGLDFGTGKFSLPPIKPLALDFSGFRDLPEDTVEAIGAKATRFEELREGQTFIRAKAAADLYVAAFLLPKIGGAPSGASTRTIPTTEELWLALNQGKIQPSMAEAPKAAHHARAFHWPLEFPDIMQRDGFDVVLGNPPWEKANIKYEEFFHTHEPSILDAKNDAERDKKIESLQNTNPRVYKMYKNLSEETEKKINFFRDAGFLPLTSNGFINYYSSFAELMLKLLGSSARAGMILQSGIATDKTNEDYFQYVMSKNYLVSLFDFVNAEKIFNIDSRFKFSLVTLSKEKIARQPLFAFNLTNPKNITGNAYALSYEDIQRVNPSTCTCPVFTAPSDAELVKKIYKNAGLFSSADERGYIQGIELHRMFNATTDQKLFQTLYQDFSEVSEGCLPVYEAKLIWHFDHRFSTFAHCSSQDIKNGNASYLSAEDKNDCQKEVVPRWAVDSCETVDFNTKYQYQNKWYLAVRMVTSASNERTLVSAIIPESGSVNSLNLATGINAKQAACLLANLTSMVMDYVVRTKVNSNNLNQWIIEQLPTIPFSRYSNQDLEYIINLVLELTYTSLSLKPFAQDLGCEKAPYAWNENRRQFLRAEIDAFYARAYDLTRDELRYILDPTEVMGAGHPSETFRVLKDKEIKQYGEYRTQRLVLAAWDRMEADGTFAELGLVANMGREQTARIELPPLAGLRNGAWAWQTTVQPRDRLRYAAQYALWISGPAQDGLRVRFLVACLAEPAMLTPHLSDSERANWLRLMGSEARPTQDIPRLRPQINAAWRDMFDTLISSGQLAESANGEWIKGQHYSLSGLSTGSADAQRTMFALQAIRRLDESSITAAIAEEDNVIYGRFGHGG